MKKIVTVLLFFLISISINAQSVKEFSREWTSISQVIDVETDSISILPESFESYAIISTDIFGGDSSLKSVLNARFDSGRDKERNC